MTVITINKEDLIELVLTDGDRKSIVRGRYTGVHTVRGSFDHRYKVEFEMVPQQPETLEYVTPLEPQPFEPPTVPTNEKE